MRQLSSDLLSDLFDGESGEAILALVTIEHADLSEPIRVTSDGVKTWSADQDSTTAEDLTSNDNDGTLTNGPSWSSEGPNDDMRGLVEFTSPEYIDVPQVSELKFDLAPFTLTCWVRRRATQEASVIGIIGNIELTSGTSGYMIAVRDDTFQFIADDSQDLYHSIESSGLFPAEQWVHAALVFDYDAGEMRTYVNGALETTVSDPDADPEIENDPTQYGTIAEGFNGDVTDVRVWDFARTQTQIVNDMDSRLTGNESGLVGYWPLNDTTDEFLPFPFQYTFPDQSDEGEMNAKLTIDNVDRRVTKAVRTLSSAPKVTTEIVRGSDPDTIEAQFPDFNLTNVSYDQHMVEGTLTLESLVSQPYPGNIFSPSNFPNLF